MIDVDEPVSCGSKEEGKQAIEGRSGGWRRSRCPGAGGAKAVVSLDLARNKRDVIPLAGKDRGQEFLLIEGQDP